MRNAFFAVVVAASERVLGAAPLPALVVPVLRAVGVLRRQEEAPPGHAGLDLDDQAAGQVVVIDLFQAVLRPFLLLQRGPDLNRDPAVGTPVRDEPQLRLVVGGDEPAVAAERDLPFRALGDDRGPRIARCHEQRQGTPTAAELENSLSIGEASTRAGRLERGLLANPVRPNVVRLMPPLTVTAEEITEATSILEAAIVAVSSRAAK